MFVGVRNTYQGSDMLSFAWPPCKNNGARVDAYEVLPTLSNCTIIIIVHTGDEFDFL